MMNVQRQVFLGLALGSSLLFGALPVLAQTGNQSDVTGAIVTTGDIVGGAFAPGRGNQSDVTGAIVTTGDIVGGAFAPAPDGSTRGRSSFASTSVQTAVNRAAAAINTQLSRGAIPGIPAAIQKALASLLSGTGDVAAAATQLQNSLVAAGANSTLAAKLVKSLQGLTAGGVVSPAKLAAAIKAYNALVDGSSGSFLQKASPQLQAIKTALSPLVNAIAVAQSRK